ncbi:ChaN family lipoprotein [Planctomycetota bacterium]
MPDARSEIIKIQKQLAGQLKDEIYGKVFDLSRQSRQYFLEYKKIFNRPFSVSTKKKLINDILKSDITFVGDYHTLRRSQKSLERILREVLRYRQDIVLALEMVHSAHQPVIDAFLAGSISEKVFLRRIDYLKTWGFNWFHFRAFFQLAKRHGFRILGINRSPGGTRSNLSLCDLHVSSVLTGSLIEHPGKLTLVLFGDIHVSPGHLPAWVQNQLAMFGQKRQHLIVYQNSETIYWALAKRRLENRVDVVRLSRREYCIQNTVPMAKWQSFLFWDENRRNYAMQFETEWYDYNELSSDLEKHAAWRDGDDGHSGLNMAEQVAHLAGTIAGFFGIVDLDLNRLQVYTPEHLDALKELRATRAFSKRQLRNIARRIAARESFYLPEASAIYLDDLSLNHAAQMAARFINHQCAPASAAGTGRDDFYARVMHSALGFLGSLVINHKRLCFKDADYRLFLEENRHRKLNPAAEKMRATAVLVLKHRKLEARHFASGRRPRADCGLFHLPYELYIAITRALGYILGDLIYAAMVQGVLSRKRIRELFHCCFEEEDIAFHTYMELTRLAERTTQVFRSKRDRL